jgi:hypothetical protein
MNFIYFSPSNFKASAGRALADVEKLKTVDAPQKRFPVGKLVFRGIG